ncbi:MULTISPECIES: malto-oligosyltrehalose trehalohydrolase [unclassified Sinorhizobium]|uniref:malto-oligosyltrehalose trehalohydrolase n=1 Tax=unclassified Sinorhizobium TaxID=2613772 RepID=UPI0035236E89
MSAAGKTNSNFIFPRSWGAELSDKEIARFRLWAPNVTAMAVRIDGEEQPMTAVKDGWFELTVADVGPGTKYIYVLPDGMTVPDPASRAQVKEVHGPSLLVDPTAFRWKNADWRGRPWEEAVLYELHIGTFTPEGTFRAAIAKLPHLAAIGITTLEIMPVAQFGGRRGWGYDGVLHYAPHPAYGSPDDMKAFVDAAHGYGIMVLLDVVYNHFGPEGNYLDRYASDFFRRDLKTPWGAAINFSQDAVRRYFIENALYWLGEFHLDGLRLDAVEQIYDNSKRHILMELAETLRSSFTDRPIHLVLEDQRNLVSLLERDGAGRTAAYTAEWNDDFHHVAHVLATGEAGGHYRRFANPPWQRLSHALRHGFIFPDHNAEHPEVVPEVDFYLPPTAFIDFLQNHDQIGNRAFGERLTALTYPPMLEALMAMLLLSPHIPFLFMGEEFGETQPFHFFCDWSDELGEVVYKARLKEVKSFGELPAGKAANDMPAPNARSTFEDSKLRWNKADSDEGRKWLDFIAKLIHLRQKFVVPLLGTARIVETEAPDAEEGVVAVSWLFEDGKLELRANLADRPLPAPPFEGAAIFSHLGPADDEPGDGRLPAYSVVVAVDPKHASRATMA